MLKQSIMSALVVSGPILGIAGTAQAQTLNDALVNGPPVTASALLLAGGPFSNPSVFGLRANASECVRVEATSASFDPKFTIVAPDGQVFRDNNGGIGTLPLVKIASARDNGVYGTAQVGIRASLVECFHIHDNDLAGRRRDIELVATGGERVYAGILL